MSFGGTSAATAHAAGIGALVMAAHWQGQQIMPPFLRRWISPDALRAVLQDTCDDLGAAGYDFDTGYGRLNASRAVLAMGYRSWPRFSPLAGDSQASGQDVGEESAGTMQGSPDDARPTLSARSSTATSTIHYSVPAAGEITLQLFDVSGRLVTTLAEGTRAAGQYELAWDGMTHRGPACAGVYFARLVTAEGVARTKLVHVR
jgi:hypothetical protein